MLSILPSKMNAPFNFLRKSQILSKGKSYTTTIKWLPKKIRPILVFYQKINDSITIMNPVAEFEHLNVSHHCWFSGFPTFFVRTTIWISSFLWQSPKKGQNWIHTLEKHNIVLHSFCNTLFTKLHVWSYLRILFAKKWNNCTKLT